MYQAIYDLIVTYIYNGAVLDNFQALVATEWATLLCAVVFFLPLYIPCRLLFRR